MISWRETPMTRFARCPVHGDLAVMKMRKRRGVLAWRWSWGCQSCLAEAAAALGDRSVESVDRPNGLREDRERER